VDCEQRTEPVVQEISRPDFLSGFVQYLMQLQTHKFHLRKEQTTLLAGKAAQNEIADSPITTFIAGGRTENFRGTRYDSSGHSVSLRDKRDKSV
jgi:hypothetical protein